MAETVIARVGPRQENGDIGLLFVDDRAFVACTQLDMMLRATDKMERALRACIGHAGIPNAADGCRAVISTAKRALGER